MPTRTSTRKRTLSETSTASTLLGDFADAVDVPATEPCARALETPEARRSDPIADSEVDVVYEELYAQIESEAMLEIMADLERELVPAYLNGSLTGATGDGGGNAVEDARESESKRPATEQLLWHITATPSMMRDLAASVRAGCGGAAAVPVSG